MSVKTLSMTFRNQAGREVEILVPNPKDGLTKAQVVLVMNNIISRNILTSSGGDLIAALEPIIKIEDTSALV